MLTMKNTKKIAFGGIISALSVAILVIAAYIEILDISLVVTVSLGIVFMEIEYGTGASISCFVAVSFLSLLLLPSKIPALLYICFGGWYPVVKKYAERLPRLLEWVVKMVLFNGALGAYGYVTIAVLGLVEPAAVLKITLLIMANVAFVVYDFALTRLITVYVRKIRNRLGIK